ncbi:alcohol dehydrogenase catalytic domain-containing protein [Brevibacillus humidisoli]|uniref:alcohol dehydrogenase catalytic domain-containing protein n=1 Tax=Brevibacillus humidisoli TaxID=2895522 RepID=UPI001E5CC2A4|nr:alcohol dehydrogenase catalytic domain-containing protein [Brevibacillus humidisoli]UFJ42443.1 alcohol dehydrogenase catalytic domain-containing protein [Brevibacillus humidisoli]
MKAAVWMGPEKVLLKEVAAPQIESASDALVKVTLTAICGTDLHPYRGHLPGFPTGTVMGHEFTGEVVAIGEAVSRVKVGDRVVASDLIACGSCWYCQRNLSYHCPSASLFGYGEVVGSYTPGGQSELVRVPYADTTLFKIPEAIADEEALFVGDILSTGYASTEKASIKAGDTVVVVGGGPVGLMAAMCAQLYQPSAVYVVEPNLRRHAIAREIGAQPLHPDQLQQIKEATEQRGADVVMEAVGSDEALTLALRLVRPAGTVVCAGAHHSRQMPFDTEDAFARELSLHFVVGNPIAYAERLLQLIEQGQLTPAKIISHRLSLEEVEHAYRLFASQQAVKVVLTP